MTTEVIVNANPNWAVDVQPVSRGIEFVGPSTRVAPGGTGRFYVHFGQDLLVQEVQPDSPVIGELLKAEPILQFFGWAHLPDHLKVVSRPFAEIAARIVHTLPRNPERTVALRKLLESKDAAVRAAVMV